MTIQNKDFETIINKAKKGDLLYLDQPHYNNGHKNMMLNILKIHTTVLQLMKYLYQLVQITKFFILKTLEKANGHYKLKKVLNFIKFLKKKIRINIKLDVKISLMP